MQPLRLTPAPPRMLHTRRRLTSVRWQVTCTRNSPGRFTGEETLRSYSRKPPGGDEPAPNREQVMLTLIRHGADLEVRDRRGGTPLLIAAEQKNGRLLFV